MSNIRHTEAQKAMGEDVVDSTWIDFFEEEEEKEKELLKAETKKENIANKSEEDKGKTEKIEDLNQETQLQTQGDHVSDSEPQEGQESGDQAKTRNRRTPKSKKGKTIRTYPQHEAKPPSVNVYPKTAKYRVPSARLRSNQIHDTMSDQGEVHHRGRKLQRRSQMKKYSSMEHSVDQAGCDRLEQKFVELQELLTRPLVADTRGITVAAGRRKVVWNPDDGNVGHGTAGKRVGTWVDQTVNEEEELGEESKAYSTLRLLQTGSQSVQHHILHEKQHTPISQTTHTNHHVTSKPPLPHRRRRGSVDSSPTSSSGTSEIIRKSERSHGTKITCHYSSDEEEKAMSPRRVYLPSDTHLKNSDSPELLEWLKRKDAEYRRNKKAERKKRREEKNNKMVENELKIARREKSAEKVQKWMEAKRKEAVICHREEKRRRKEEKAREEAARRARSPAEGAIKICAIDLPSSAVRPQSASSGGPKNYISIKRPESAAAAVVDTVEGAAPKPPDSNFVYKRPVSGRIRLMKLQKERNDTARKADQQRTEELTAEEKQKQARTSYDAWLVSKRREDMEKRKEAKLQKEVNKSDPEMTTVITEMARKRIDRIKNGKKRINTGLSTIDDDANSRFGGADFGHDVKREMNEVQTVEIKGERDSTFVHKPSSYHLVVEGTAASLVELNMQAKLASAKTHMPIPQSAFSPRHRPSSAKVRQESAKSSGRVRQVLETDFSLEPNPFKLPFPDSLGVPEQVRHVQNKIFSKNLTESQQRSSHSERPEPQGCVTYPVGVDGVLPKHSSGDTGSGRSETTVRASLQLLQQIEAEAEKESVQNGVRSAFRTVADISMDGLAAWSAKEIEEEIEEAVPESADSVQNGDDHDEEPVSVEPEIYNFKDEREDIDLLKKNEDAKDESSKKADIQITSEDKICGPLAEAYTHSPPDVQKPFDKTQKADAEPKNIKVSEDTEEADKSEKAEAENQDWDDATRKSLSKHVSFSEDLTTVFEPGSTETSSSFGYEKEDGDKEMEYMTLDEAPDPEG